MKIYFHVGLGKTGTTYLQYNVFPFLKGICYIQRTKYKNATRIIKKRLHSKYLISREFDQQLEHEVKKFSAIFPKTVPIIVFRRHDHYIASQYKRFLKNGYRYRFKEFFNLHNDSGHFRKDHLNYTKQIKLLEQYFNSKPIVLIYESLKSNPKKFVLNFAEKLNVSINPKKLNFSKRHVSYSEKQLKVIFIIGKYINLKKRRIFKNGLLHFFWKLYQGFLRYCILYIAIIIPSTLLSKKSLISKNELEEVRRYFEEDWNYCLQYAKKQDIASFNA